mmetsp:Transcript_45556/g.84402  ORF Transcript_45556/g.84402 Transcript_45556/m.84402 type:complete len:326 (-) Transcript_45556:339-1316(-)
MVVLRPKVRPHRRTPGRSDRVPLHESHRPRRFHSLSIRRRQRIQQLRLQRRPGHVEGRGQSRNHVQRPDSDGRRDDVLRRTESRVRLHDGRVAAKVGGVRGGERRRSGWRYGNRYWNRYGNRYGNGRRRYGRRRRRRTSRRARRRRLRRPRRSDRPEVRPGEEDAQEAVQGPVQEEAQVPLQPRSHGPGRLALSRRSERHQGLQVVRQGVPVLRREKVQDSGRSDRQVQQVLHVAVEQHQRSRQLQALQHRHLQGEGQDGSWQGHYRRVRRVQVRDQAPERRLSPVQPRMARRGIVGIPAGRGFFGRGAEHGPARPVLPGAILPR